MGDVFLADVGLGNFIEEVNLFRCIDRGAVAAYVVQFGMGAKRVVEPFEEFSQTLAFLRRCDFAQMHIFPYSIRPGTKAAEMEQVPGPVKEERAARASAVAAELHRAYLQGCVGQTYPVLFEQRKDGCAAGHAPNYMPVEVQTQEDYHNTVRHVKITGVVNDILMGEVT